MFEEIYNMPFLTLVIALTKLIFAVMIPLLTVSVISSFLMLIFTPNAIKGAKTS